MSRNATHESASIGGSGAPSNGARGPGWVYRALGVPHCGFGATVGARCPALADPPRGRWYFAVQVTDRPGRYPQPGISINPCSGGRLNALVAGQPAAIRGIGSVRCWSVRRQAEH